MSEYKNITLIIGIDILDVVMLVNSILFADVDELLNADINNDGEINILDVVNLVSIILVI